MTTDSSEEVEIAASPVVETEVETEVEALDEPTPEEVSEEPVSEDDAKDELAEAADEWPKLEDLDFDEEEAETVSLTEAEDSGVDYATKDIEAFTPSFARSTGALPASIARHGGGPAIAELVAARAEIRRLETRCANLEESHHEAGKQQARRQADFDNDRRRVERERDEMRFLTVGEVVKQLMPLVDNLLRALAMQAREATTPENDPQHFVQGVQLIAQQLDDILSNLGIEIVPSVGHPFDPEIHEAVALDATAAFPPQTVSQEILRGYRLGARVLRPAMVKVAAPPAPAPAEN